MRVSLPSDLASELVEARLAVPARSTRGVGDVLEVLVAGVNTGVGVVTIVTAPEVVRQLAERLRRAVRGRGGRPATITVVSRHVRATFEVDEGAVDEEAVERLGAFLAHALAPPAPAEPGAGGGAQG